MICKLKKTDENNLLGYDTIKLLRIEDDEYICIVDKTQLMIIMKEDFWIAVAEQKAYEIDES